jgi:hypothetical protein
MYLRLKLRAMDFKFSSSSQGNTYSPNRNVPCEDDEPALPEGSPLVRALDQKIQCLSQMIE